MTAHSLYAGEAVFLLVAFAIIVIPMALLRLSGLAGLMPLVVVQIAVGIAMGPSVFGKLAPDTFHLFASQDTLSAFSGVASIAVLIFGMVSGMHLDPRVFSGKERAFWPVVIANVVVPMALGCAAAAWILARHPDELLPGVTRIEFIAAIAICVSMKALPVLSAILAEMNLLGRRIGTLALGVAGVNDIVLWILIGVLLASAAGHAGGHHGLPPVYLLILLPTYLIFMVKVARPMLGDMVKKRMLRNEINARAMALVGAATIASALATELMGLHYIIGAFLMGAIMPVELRQPIIDRLQLVSVALLMPFFFTLTGMRTLIDFNSPVLLEVFLLTTCAATLGIVGGTVLAGRLFGERWRAAFGLGWLLQSKGLTELIVLTVLLDANIISPRIFSAMILMALVSTAAAMPFARLALVGGAPRNGGGLVGDTKIAV
jgi:Kef-type K+ transport system membrane component KefB